MHALAGTSDRAADTQAPGDRPGGRRRAGVGESGFVMVVVLFTMVVMLGLVAAVASSSSHVSSTSLRTSAAAQALAAAQSGEQVALFRLNNAGQTTGATGAMGTGASYTYTVAALSSSSSACTGLWVQNSVQTVQQDCVTSVGHDGNVYERAQARVAGYPQTSLYPVNGLFAINGFSAANNVAGTLNLGSNAQMTFNNTITLSGQIQYQSGKISYTNNACSGNCVLSQQAGPFTVPSVPASAYAAAQTTNNDAALSWGAQFTTSPSTYSVSSNGSNNATINVPAGTYYYCALSLGNGTTLNTTGWPVTIYIDSSYDTTGPCKSSTSGDGSLTGSNGFAITNTSGTASNVQLYFYGQPGCTTSCPNEFSPNSQTLNADVFAPYSSSAPGGAFTMTGDMVIGQMTANNVITFGYQAPSGSSSGSTNTTYYPTADATCIPSTTLGGTTGTC
jgi:hypothetical protein